jgi:hypothetical protein
MFIQWPGDMIFSLKPLQILARFEVGTIKIVFLPTRVPEFKAEQRLRSYQSTFLNYRCGYKLSSLYRACMSTAPTDPVNAANSGKQKESICLRKRDQLQEMTEASAIQ